jgi:uncharacterized membrane protein SirB2
MLFLFIDYNKMKLHKHDDDMINEAVVHDEDDLFINELLNKSHKTLATSPYQIMRHSLHGISAMLLILAAIIACFKLFCWILFIILTWANGAENEPQRHLLYNYAQIPFAGGPIGIMCAPIYVMTFYCSIFTVPLCIILSIIAVIIPKYIEEWNLRTLMLVFAMITDTHLGISCICLLFTLKILPMTRQSILSWNVATLLFHVFAAAGSVVSFARFSGDKILVGVYYTELYCLILYQFCCVVSTYFDYERKQRYLPYDTNRTYDQPRSLLTEAEDALSSEEDE